MRKLQTILLAIFFLIPMGLFASPIESWKDQILYFVLLDRFNDGDKTNNFEVDSRDPFAFHGGDVKGLVNKLDYLNSLGVTGLWVSPLFKNRDRRFFKHSSYHGYWVWDFWNPDERFASEKDLKLLRSRTRHFKMKLLLDMVVNHMGYDAPFMQANPDWFNQNGNIEDWNDTAQLENNNIFGLPDFNSQKPVVKTFFKLVGQHWIKNMSPDGFRLDAVKHVPSEFWKEFNSEMKRVAGKEFLLLGEYLNGNAADLLKTWNQGGFGSLFDFPLYYTIKEVFAEKGDCRKLASRLYFDRNYPDPGMLATFIDNHDLDRFFTLCGENKQRYLLGLSFLLSARGIPTLCYGDEQGLTGKEGPIPMNRRDMVFDQTSDLFKATQKLIGLRKEFDPLRRGVQCHLFADESAYAFSRLTPDALAIAVFNNADQPRQVEFAFPFQLLNQMVIEDKFGSARAMVREGRFEVFLPARTSAIFVPRSKPGFYESTFRHWQKRLENENAWGRRKITVKLKFDYVPEKVKLFLTGNCDELGNWSSGRGAVAMERTSDDEFEAILELPIGKVVECKCFHQRLLDDETVETTWQNEANTIFEIKDAGSEYIHIGWKTL